MLVATDHRNRKRLCQLLEDFGYRLTGDVLICKGVRGYLPERIVGRIQDAYCACEHLLPIIADDEFGRRYQQICQS